MSGIVNENVVRNFAKSSVAVETGFLAAGMTVAIASAIQSCVIVLSWLIG